MEKNVKLLIVPTAIGYHCYHSVMLTLIDMYSVNFKEQLYIINTILKN